MRRCTATVSLELPADVDARDVLEAAVEAFGGHVRRLRVYPGDHVPPPVEDERARGVPERPWP